MFHDRTDAGQQLGAALARCRGTRPLIIAIPRGGVAVAWPVADALDTTLAILVVRKLPYPDNPEAGFGAVAEDGTLYFAPGAAHDLPSPVVVDVVSEQKAEVLRRIRALRGGQPLPDLHGRHVILVDDGVAMGSTMQAAILCCRHRGAGRVTVAVPVASAAAREALSDAADALVVLQAPQAFRAVADFYERWYDVPDSEVMDILEQAGKAGRLAPAAPSHNGTAARSPHGQPPAPACPGLKPGG